MPPARARTRTASSGVEGTNHEATAPPKMEQNANWTTLSYSSNCFIFRAKKLETTSTTKKQQNLKTGKVRFRLNIDVRKEMEDSRLNAIKQLIMFVKGRLNFTCKSTTAAIVDLTESLLDNWLKNNLLWRTTFAVCLYFFFTNFSFQIYFSTVENRKTESCGNSL